MKIARTLIVLLLGTASSLSAALTKTTTTLSSSLNPSTYGQAVTFTAIVSSAAGPLPASANGDVVAFMQGANELGTGNLSDGSATFTTSTLSTGGTDNVKAVYEGDSIYAGSTSIAVKQVVDPAPTTTTLASLQNPANVGQLVTFTSNVTTGSGATVTGTVGFYAGSTKLGNAPLSGGLATYKITKEVTTTESITAEYNRSTSFAASTSGAVSETWGAGTFTDSTMTWDSITRYYEVFVPTALPANPPMVLMLHGTRYTSTFDPEAVISLNFGWNTIANEYGFILVKPASTWDPATTQWNWNSYFMDAAFPPPAPGTCTAPPATACPDDAGFLRALITNLTTLYNVNANQVYVTGFSSGAQMTERVGVEISDLVAAIAPVSGQLVNEQGTVSPPLPDPPNPPTNSISVQEWHGTLDENLWPCGYGTTSYSSVTFTLDTVDDTFKYWVTAPQNSCTTLETTQPLCLNGVPNNTNDAPTPGISGDTGNIATGCTNNVEVQFIWEAGVGHNPEPQTDVDRWLFFAAHPKPSTGSE